jgi:PEP-CTERM motif-containing protein
MFLKVKEHSVSQVVVKHLKKKRVWIPLLILVVASSGYAAARQLIWYPPLGLYGEFNYESELVKHDSVAGQSSPGQASGGLQTVGGASPTPEPGTIILLATGLAGLIAGKKKFLK